MCLSNAHLRCTPLDPRIRLIVPLSCASSAQSDNHGDAHAKTGAPSFCRPRTIAELWWLLRIVRKENVGLTVCHDLPLIHDLVGGGWRGNRSNRFQGVLRKYGCYHGANARIAIGCGFSVNPMWNFCFKGASSVVRCFASPQIPGGVGLLATGWVGSACLGRC